MALWPPCRRVRGMSLWVVHFWGMLVPPPPPTSHPLSSVHDVQCKFFFLLLLSCASKTSVSHHDGSGIISILLADGERPAPTQRQGRHCILFVHPFFISHTPFDLFCWWMDSSCLYIDGIGCPCVGIVGIQIFSGQFSSRIWQLKNYIVFISYIRGNTNLACG